MSSLNVRDSRPSLFVAAILLMSSGCLTDTAPPTPEETGRQRYTIELPDGRTAVVEGERRGDMLYVGGDMMFALRAAPGGGTRAASVAFAQLWQTKVIPYVFATEVTEATRQRVRAAMEPWRAAGFIFLPRTNQPEFVTIVGDPAPGFPWICSATVGFQSNNNTYSAGSACTAHDYVHEWGHILGLYHEHERTDRGQFITVNTDIDPSLGQTIATRGGIDQGPYDFNSVMHYDAFGRNADGSLNTAQVRITPLDNRPLDSFGFTPVPSAQDLNTLAQLYANRQPGVPLYQLYSTQFQDFFYTTSNSQRIEAIVIAGYADWGIAARVEPNSWGGTAPFWRFYKGPPQTDHFYTTDPGEFNTVAFHGWQFEGTEGNLYTAPSPGLVPLYRYNHWDGATGDLMHHYTIDFSLHGLLIANGWILDGVAGYVYPL